MKRRAISLLLCLTLFAACPLFRASANQWGLTGELYGAVSQETETWNSYRAARQASGELALMSSRYHNVLLLLADGMLHRYTKAVYQPQSGQEDVTLEATDTGFLLAYGSEERYTFRLTEEGYALEQAQVGNLSLKGITDQETGCIYGYEAVQGEERATWYASQLLGDFNISLFPRSVAEIRRLNLLNGALDSGKSLFPRSDGDMPSGQRYAGLGSGTEAVYSAPEGESAWRAADGKAAVGLGGELWLLRCFYHPSSRTAYACISYEVSQRTHRIGFIRGTALDPDADTSWAEDESVWRPYEQMIGVNLRAVTDTYLTDDPDVSQYPQFTVPAETLFTCMGLYGESYAYVSAEVKDGRFVDDGAIVWGFVPLSALEPLYAEEAPQEIRDALVGLWDNNAGGSMIDAPIAFYADGTYQAASTQGSWTVRVYDSAANLYWNDPPYELWLTEEGTGRVVVRGLDFDAGGFSLTNSEGSGGYAPTAETVGG